MTRTSIWKVISDAGLGSEPQIAGLLRWASDTNRLYIHDGTAYKNVNLTHKGAWSGSIAYKQFDTVTYLGSAWRALRNNIGITPVEGADWTIFVSKGDQGIQGTQGIQGPGGATGSSGSNATTTTTLSFVQPASGATVSVTVADTSWMAAGQELFVAGGGYYSVSSITDATHVVLTNRGYTGNTAAGATIASVARVSPAGLQGPATLAIATQAQTDAGTDDTTAVSPLKMHASTATETRTGVAEVATQAETDAGTDDARFLTSLKLGKTDMLRLLPTEVSVTGATTAAYRKMHRCTGTAYTVGLPTAVGHGGEAVGFVIPAATTFVTLDPNASETVDGLSTLALSGLDVVVLVSDNANWTRVVGGPKSLRRLVYSPTSDLESAFSLTANTWKNLGAQQSFSVSGPQSEVQISVSGFAQAVGVGASGAAVIGSRFVVDGTVTVLLGGDVVKFDDWANFFSGTGPRLLNGLSVGSHTLQAQVVSSVTGVQLYCRPSTAQPENLYLSVVEHRG